LIAELVCDLHNKHRDGAEWRRRVGRFIFRPWPAIMVLWRGTKAGKTTTLSGTDSDMIFLHDRELTRVFHDGLAQHRDKIQETAVIGPLGALPHNWSWQYFWPKYPGDLHCDATHGPSIQDRDRRATDNKRQRVKHFAHRTSSPRHSRHA